MSGPTAAAHAAGVEVREIADLPGFVAVKQLFEDIWRPEAHNPPVTTELLRALTKTGNYVAGAFQAQRLVGASVGFFGPPQEATMHSHITGVVADRAGRNVGYALKLHQRAWALDRGVRTISWTFDPLVSRNAYFNLVKLGATAAEYLPDFYGSMHDDINAGDLSDRMLVRWDLHIPASAPPGAEGAVFALRSTPDGGPAVGSLDGDTLLVAVPHDIEAMRAKDPEQARLWRSALRDVLAPLMAGDGQVAGFDKAGWYIVRRDAR